MDKGTVVADMCYEYFEGNQKKHRKIGSLVYFRNHSGGCPSAQLRLDLVPSVAWKSNPECWFIGNFIESEKIPEAPYVCGNIYVPSDVRGDRTQLGYIITDEKDDGSATQYRFKLFGVPLREIKKGIHKAYLSAIQQVLNEPAPDTDMEFQFVDRVASIMDGKKHSLFLSVEMEG